MESPNYVTIIGLVCHAQFGDKKVFSELCGPFFIPPGSERFSIRGY
jgi:hypothetical protein